jgi:hypothetical protein
MSRQVAIGTEPGMQDDGFEINYLISHLIKEVRFAPDSTLEESGFEPLVPLTPKRPNA